MKENIRSFTPIISILICLFGFILEAITGNKVFLVVGIAGAVLIAISLFYFLLTDEETSNRMKRREEQDDQHEQERRKALSEVLARGEDPCASCSVGQHDGQNCVSCSDYSRWGGI